MRTQHDAAIESASDAEVPVHVDAKELQRTRRVLEAIQRDHGLLATVSAEERRALLTAAGRVVHAEPKQKRLLLAGLRRRKREAQKEHDRKLRAGTGIRVVRAAPVFEEPTQLPERAPGERPAAVSVGPELKKPKTCYVCKCDFARLHHFYDALCPECGAVNYEKRFQSEPIEGRVALVTGARVKIGYVTALKLLRAGATVIATTRFPHDAARRYASEKDYETFKARLRIHGLDLRHSPSVELFCGYLRQELMRLDLLVNNACQTIRRPPGFYEHLLDFESRPPEELPEGLRPVLRAQYECIAALETVPRLATGAHERDGGLVAWSGGGAGLGLRASARLSQVRYDFDDAARPTGLFPLGRLDADLQQLDLREHNTWRQTLADVPTPEMIEVQLVNAVAPFILCSKLKPLMIQAPGRDKHVVNVSAMEGIFSRGTKTERHPHTNMAKAALNMLTLTAARDYIQAGIHMNAVDTGWITDEDPFVHAERKREELDFQPPLDIVDGAARLLDPFFEGLR
ncbi:MAG TPA: SDR family oxidoreductase, partial [Candidatus Krumholzibacteria bacterium]